jgi:hypothetical protein
LEEIRHGLPNKRLSGTSSNFLIWKNESNQTHVSGQTLKPLIKVFETMNNDDYGHLDSPLQQIVRSQVRQLSVECTALCSAIALLNHFPGGVYAPATLAAFSAMPLNSLGVQARTVSSLDIEPVAATAIPVATASDPSATSVTSTTSFEPVVKYIAINLPPAFSTNALMTLERSEGLSTIPFTPEWEYEA